MKTPLVSALILTGLLITSGLVSALEADGSTDLPMTFETTGTTTGNIQSTVYLQSSNEKNVYLSLACQNGQLHIELAKYVLGISSAAWDYSNLKTSSDCGTQVKQLVDDVHSGKHVIEIVLSRSSGRLDAVKLLRAMTNDDTSSVGDNQREQAPGVIKDSLN